MYKGICHVINNLFFTVLVDIPENMEKITEHSTARCSTSFQVLLEQNN